MKHYFNNSQKLIMQQYSNYCLGKGHPMPPLLKRLTNSTAGCVVGNKSGDSTASDGTGTSNNAPVGHEPIHERQPTQFVSTTITGLLPLLLVFSCNGSKASNGQNGIHKSQPVQSDSVIATIACPISFRDGMTA